MNVPSFLVRVDSQKHIDFALNSPFGGGRPGRNKRKAQKCAARLCTSDSYLGRVVVRQEGGCSSSSYKVSVISCVRRAGVLHGI